MTKPLNPDEVRIHDAALHAVVKRAGLRETEALALTLKDLHLGGKDPRLEVWDEDLEHHQVVPLDDVTQRALVDWLLLRPDSPSTLLFGDEEGRPLTEAEARRRIARLDRRQASQPRPPHTKIPTLSPDEIQAEHLPDLDAAPSAGPPAPPFSPRPPRGRPEPASPPPAEAEAPAAEPAGEVEEEPAAAPFEREAEFEPGEEAPAEAPAFEDELPEPEPEAKPAPTRLVYTPIITTGVLLVCCVGALTLAILQGENIYNRLLGRAPGDEGTPVAVATRPPDAGTAAQAESPAPTPAATPSATSAPSPTPTAPPTETPTPLSTETPTPPPTPVPATDTPTPEPTATPAPTQPPAPPPAPSPTAPGFKYPAPTLGEPAADQIFNEGNTIDLTWQAVNLAGDEQYAVRVIYFHENEAVYRGQQVRDPIWTVPLAFFHEADGPEFRYTWFVFIERVNPDGSTTPISPESERRDFYWR